MIKIKTTNDIQLTRENAQELLDCIFIEGN